MSETRDSRSLDTNRATEIDNLPKEWTLMFYFASDNPLAPGIVSQLKAIKDAGFHHQVHVVARFDPHTKKTPSHIFDVNLINKLKSNSVCDVGFTDNDPYVRTLVPDRLWADEVDRNGDPIRERLQKTLNASLENGRKYDPPIPPSDMFYEDSERISTTNKWFVNPEENRPIDEPSPKASLKSFLQFCADKYPARRYILFILGHGVVVGNDLFLFDESAEEHSLTLKDLGKILKDFVNVDLKKNGGEFELISFHSCSMSGLEVAYELKDTAKYMLAAEGPSFVGSFPYRQILIRIFNDVEKLRKEGTAIDVEDTVKKIFHYCFYNSYDFQLAGYSYDSALTDLRCLNKDGEGGVKIALQGLSEALIAGLTNPEDRDAERLFVPNTKASGEATDGEPVVETEIARTKAAAKLEASSRAIRNLIVLSHLEAQSYYEENFTDLLDFCFCLKRRCEDMETLLDDQVPAVLSRIKDACTEMMRALKNYDRSYTRERGEGRGREADNTDDEDDSAGDSENRKPIFRSGFAGPAYQYSHGLSIYFPWSVPIGSKMWDTEYAEYELIKGTKPSWKRFLERYFEATMRLTQAEERAKQGWQVRPLNKDAELLEDISGLVFNEYGQLKDDPHDKTDNVRDDCVCPELKNYPPFTQRAVPVSRFLMNKIRFE